jgi:hypothetical protein
MTYIVIDQDKIKMTESGKVVANKYYKEKDMDWAICLLILILEP